MSWTVTSNQPWLAVSPASGSGARDLSVTVAPGALTTPGTAVGSITITLSGAGNLVAPVGVTLVTMIAGTSVAPIGVVDTPLANATGVVGAIPVTGWALDDVEVASLFVCRNAVMGESAAPDGRCGGATQVYLGDAVFIDDARPDVVASFPAYPRNYRGGWGFMLLTNMLPNQGNGSYTLSAYAMDREGRVVLVGSRTFTCDNAHATRPFGAIDTPGQGGTASSANYVNFGWALTPLPKFIPNDGSTMTVFVDGVSLGHPSYNNFRADIASLFPGLNNTSGAVGFRVIDTTALTNGLHTIAWTVSDNLGATEGHWQPLLQGVERCRCRVDRRARRRQRVSQQRGARGRTVRTQPGARTSRVGSGGTLAQFRGEQLRPSSRAERGSEPGRTASRRPGRSTHRLPARG